MKTIINILLLLVLSNFAIAQNMRDVIELKDGSVLKGTITEQKPGIQLKIKLSDNKIYTYRYDEIKKVSNENIVSDETKANTQGTILAQNLKPFEIKAPFRQTTFNGARIKRFRTLKQAMLKMNDKEINEYMQRLTSKRTVGTVVAFAGVVVMGVGLVQQMNAVNSSTNVYAMSAASNTGQNVMLGGMVLVLIGEIVGIGGKSIMRKAMMRYNDISGEKTSLILTPMSVNKNMALGVSLIRKF